MLTQIIKKKHTKMKESEMKLIEALKISARVKRIMKTQKFNYLKKMEAFVHELRNRYENQLFTIYQNPIKYLDL